VLSGNRNSALGALAGLREQNCGMIWFDAHGDFNTPEITESGFFDGMGMAIAAGHCWKKLAATIPGLDLCQTLVLSMPEDVILIVRNLSS
jgi:arginase